MTQRKKTLPASFTVGDIRASLRHQLSPAPHHDIHLYRLIEPVVCLSRPVKISKKFLLRPDNVLHLDRDDDLLGDLFPAFPTSQILVRLYPRRYSQSSARCANLSSAQEPGPALIVNMVAVFANGVEAGCEISRTTSRDSTSHNIELEEPTRAKWTVRQSFSRNRKITAVAGLALLMFACVLIPVLIVRFKKSHS